MSEAGTPTILGPFGLAHGPLATQRLLLTRLHALLGEQRLVAGGLRDPVLVIVPSDTLRQHVQACLMEQRGPAVVGLSVRTLRAVAWAVVERAVAIEGEPAVAAEDEALWSVVVRRVAAQDPILRELFGGFDDGYGLVVAAARDFLSAGVETVAAQRIALQAQLAELEQKPAQRAMALAEVAIRSATQMAEWGISPPGTLFRAAARAVERYGPSVVMARAVVIHGFADASGEALALLLALRRQGAELLLDQPTDPADPSRLDHGCRFLSRLMKRLVDVPPRHEIGRAEQKSLRDSQVATAGDEAVQLELCAFADQGEEIDGIASRLQSLANAGVPWEAMAVVVRDLGPYRIDLRRCLSHWGIPYRGLAAPAELFAEHRRWRALKELIRLGQAAQIEQLFEAELLQPLAEIGSPQQEGLRILLRRSGLTQLEALHQFDVEAWLAGRETLPLPLSGARAASLASLAQQLTETAEQGAESESWSEDDVGVAPEQATRTTPGVSRRSLPAAVLRHGTAYLRSVAVELAGWTEGTLAEHLDRLAQLVAKRIPMPTASMISLTLAEQWPQLNIQQLRDAAGARGLSLVLSRQEFLLWLTGHVDPTPVAPLSGGGVWVLDAMHARAMTFKHLFVLGLNRGLFPRTATTDALLPESLRLPLAQLFADFPAKDMAYEEERYLFAQLCAAAPHVVLSWCKVDHQGKALSPSLLVARTLAHEPMPPAADANPAAEVTRDTGIRPAQQLLRDSALYGDEQTFAELWETWNCELMRELAPLAIGRASELVAKQARDGWNGSRAKGVHGSESTSAESTDPSVSTGVQPQRRERLARPFPDRLLDPQLAPRLVQLHLAAVAAREGHITQRDHKREPWIGPFVGWMLRSPNTHEKIYITTIEQFARCPWQAFLRHELRLLPPVDPDQGLPGITTRMVGKVVHATLEAWANAEAARHACGAAQDSADRLQIDAQVEQIAQQVGREEGVSWPGLNQVLAALARPMVERALRFICPPGVADAVVIGGEVEGQLTFVDVEQQQRSIFFRADLAERVGGVLRLTDYKTSAFPLDQSKKPDTRARKFAQAVASGQVLQAAAYAAADGEAQAMGRYLFVAPNIDDALVEWSLNRSDQVVVEQLPQVLQHLYALRHAGLFPPRLEDHRRRASPNCRSCELADACAHGDSAVRARLSEWLRHIVSKDAHALGETEQAWRRLAEFWQFNAAAAAANEAGSS